MLSLEQWREEFRPEEFPWLLLGKGPSFERLHEFDASAYAACALNHVIRERSVTVAHAVDLEVVLECAEAIDAHARFLLLPRRPHLGFRPGPPLEQHLRRVPLLRKLSAERRLVAYALDPDPARPRRVRHFSAELALEALLRCGVRTVRTLGVDGGSGYGAPFADLAQRTRLAAGHASYDLQFEGIARLLREHDVLFGPLDLSLPVRVFVGADEAQRLPARVLEYSLRCHARASLRVERIDGAQLSRPRRPEHRTRTGFSFARFEIPQRCEYRGRAFYLDADMLVFGDLLELWRGENTAPVRYAPQPAGREAARFSLLLLDCERLDWDPESIVRGLDEGRYSYEELLWDLAAACPTDLRADLPPAWNSPERYSPGRTKLLHYTDMPRQPWVSRRNPLAPLWYSAARRALDEGFLAASELEDAVRRGEVSPLLPSWLGLSSAPGAHRRALNWRAPWERRCGGAPPRRLVAGRQAFAGLRDAVRDAVWPRAPLLRRVEGLRVRHGGWSPLGRRALHLLWALARERAGLLPPGPGTSPAAARRPVPGPRPLRSPQGSRGEAIGGRP
ncbi:MAG: hypothetical protein D6731_19995 [Planctomycetota bacterium]|nr:MAG: hypothetical protein D6731_19995 [Planctomycetota bacterium]